MPLLVHPDSTCDVCLSNYDWDNPLGIGTGTPHAIACGHIFCKSCLNQVLSNNSSVFSSANTVGTAPCPLCRKLYVRVKAKKLHVDRPDPPKLPEYLAHLERLASCCHEKSTASTWEDAIRHTMQWLEEQQPDECVSVRRMLRLVESTRAHEERIADLNTMLTAGPSSSRKQDEQETIEGLRKQLQDAITTAKKLEKKLVRREKKTQPPPLPLPPQPIPDECLPEFLRHTLMPNSPDNRRPYAEYEERNGLLPASFSDLYSPEVSYYGASTSNSMPGGYYEQYHTPDTYTDELADEFGYRVGFSPTQDSSLRTRDGPSNFWPLPLSDSQDTPLGQATTGFSFPPRAEAHTTSGSIDPYTRSRTTVPSASNSRTLPSTSRTLPSASRPRSSAEYDRRRSTAILPNGRARGSAADEVIVYEAPHEAPVPPRPVYTGPESIYAPSPASTPAPRSTSFITSTLLGRSRSPLRVDTSRPSETLSDGSRRSSVTSWDTVSNPRSSSETNSLGLSMIDFSAGYGTTLSGGRQQASRRGSRSSLSSELSHGAVANSFLQPRDRDANSRRGSQTFQAGVPTTIEEEDSPVEEHGIGFGDHGRTGFEAFDPRPPPASTESSRTVVLGLGHRSYSSQDASASASTSQERERRRNARRTASYDSWNTSTGSGYTVTQAADLGSIFSSSQHDDTDYYVRQAARTPPHPHSSGITSSNENVIASHAYQTQNSLGLDLGQTEIASPRPGYVRGRNGRDDSQTIRLLNGTPSRQHTASARVTQASW